MTDQQRADIWQRVRDLNPGQPDAVVRIYADACCAYLEAQGNIRQYGEVVQHPRTGAPITNPYAAVRKEAAATIGKYPRMKSGGVLEPGAEPAGGDE